MRATRLILALAVLGLMGAAFLPTAASHDGPSITVVAPPSDECPQGKSFCLEFNNQVPAFGPGDVVDLVFYNDDSTTHSIMITTASQADQSHQDTPQNAALSFTGNVEAGSSSSENTFTVPDGVSTLYVWCDVSGHEAGGMWIEVPVSGATSGDGTSSTPVPAWTALAALLGAGIVLAPPRRD